MRLDKFLKVSRIIKRRPIAKIVVDGGKAKLNGKIAKSSTEVKVGNILEIEYYDRYFKFEIFLLEIIFAICSLYSLISLFLIPDFSSSTGPTLIT